MSRGEVAGVRRRGAGGSFRAGGMRDFARWEGRRARLVGEQGRPTSG